VVAAILVAVILLFGAAPSLAEESPAPDPGKATAEEPEKKKKDKKDRYRFLPIPVFITEPAIGEGLGAALTVFHPRKRESAGEDPRAATPKSIADETKRGEAPPVVSAAFGGYTSNGTWAVGVGHANNFRNDTIRYAGFVAFASVTSDFYVQGAPIEFELEGALVYQDLKFRAGNSRFLFGASLSYFDATNVFDPGLGPGVPPEFLTDDLRQLGIAAKATYEGRDNTTMPTRGQFAELGLWRYEDSQEGDFDYWKPTLRFFSFHPLGERFTLGLRLDVEAVDGDPPFFGYPWVKLRGVPAMRFQGETAGALELQGRFRAGRRWIVLGFAGMGFTGEDLEFMDDKNSIYTTGAGARFNIFKDRKIWAGLAIARGPEEWAWYIQVNHPW
jgi:hypothetical protein